MQKQRVYGALIHIDIKGEKLWIQYDGTEVGVANELVEEGIPKEDIVLAYHAPFLCQYDGFAVGWGRLGVLLSGNMLSYQPISV